MTPASNPPDLRPLELGEIVDRTATFWRSNLGALFRLFLAYQLTVYVVMKVCTFAIYRAFPLFTRGRAISESTNLDALVPQFLGGTSALMVVAIVVWWATWVTGVAGTRYSVDLMLGKPASLEQGVRRAWQKLSATTGAFALSLVWGFGVGLLCMVPGVALIGLGAWIGGLGALLAVLGAIVLGLGMIGALLWYALRFMLVAQVLAMEDVGAWGALRRSGRLLSGRIGPGFFSLVAVRATILYTAVMFLLLSVNLVSSMPALIIQSTYGHIFDPAHSDPNAVPQALLIPAELFQVGLQALFSPLLVIFAAVFYVDMRVRREGLDLELKLAAPPASAP